MKTVRLPLGPSGLSLELPDSTDVYAMSSPRTVPLPGRAVREALAAPIGSPPLSRLAADRIAALGACARACLVVSDNTRPVPYKGASGILLLLIEVLLDAGFVPGNILVLVATGTHRAMGPGELRDMIDPKVFELGVEVVNHDCRDASSLLRLGSTSRGGEVFVNRRYLEADLKILTGLVESHFMAGASGGRKSVCPGIVGERSTFVFHGASLMAHPEARDLNLVGNPVHEEALEVARMAGVDFIVNVTLDHAFRLTGVFAGDLEKAHEAAVATMRASVGFQVDGEYDIVVSHAGFVGVNHYQAAKVAVASLGALAKGGHLIVVADHRDASGPIGSLQYRTTLQLLKLIGAEAFTRTIKSQDWTFIPEQWQTQMWTKFFNRVPAEHLHYYAPQLDDRHWEDLPGVDGRVYLSPEHRQAPRLEYAGEFVSGALAAAMASYTPQRRSSLRVAYLSDGPYGIPYRVDRSLAEKG